MSFSNSVEDQKPELICKLAELETNSLNILFDISNKCNLKCIMCHFSFDHIYNQKAAYLNPGMFENILHPISPFVKKLTLSAGSEPLTSPFFFDILKIIQKYNFPYVNFLTNGSLLSKKHVHSLLESNVNEIALSLHAATKKTYEYILRGASFDRLLQNIEYFVTTREKYKLSSPRLHVNVTLMKSNIHELEKIVILGASLGVASISFRHLIQFAGLNVEQQSLVNYKRGTNHWLIKALETASKLNIPILNCPDFWGVNLQEAQGVFVQSKPQLLTEIHDSRSISLQHPANEFPFGYFDYPEDQYRCKNHSLELSGWALSKNKIKSVEIWSKPLLNGAKENSDTNALIYIGKACFHNGTRPDISNLFPFYPYNYRAGWNFILSRNQLSTDLQNDKINLHAVVIDSQGNRVNIGNRTVIFDQDSIAKPQIFCSKPFDSLYIDSHGFAFPYPDCHTTIPFGSFLKNTFKEIWFGDDFMNLRQSIVDNNPPKMCKNCAVFINREIDNEQYFIPKIL